MADWLRNSSCLSCLCLSCLAPQTWICPVLLSSWQSVAPSLLSELKGFRSVLNCISLSQYSQLIFQEFLFRLLRILSFRRAQRENYCSRDYHAVSVLKGGWETWWPSWTWGDILCMSAHCSWNVRMTQHGQIC